MHYLSYALVRNNEYKSIMKDAFQNIFNSDRKYILKDPVVLLAHEKHSDYHFIFYSNFICCTVLFAKPSKHDPDPLQYYVKLIKEEKKKTGQYPHSLLGTGMQCFFIPDIKIQLNNGEEKEALKRFNSEHYSITQFSPSRDDFYNFNQALFNHGYLKEPIAQCIFDKNEELMINNKFIKHDVSQFIKNILKLNELTRKLNIKSKAKGTFNDGDASFWIPALDNCICIKSQNSSFIASYQNNDWQIYHFGNEHSTYNHEKKAIQAVIDGTMQQKDKVLIVQDNNPLYVGDWFGCLSQDVEFSIEEANDRLSRKIKPQ